MWHRLKDILTHHKLAATAFAVVLTIAGIFGGNAVSQMVYWSDPAKLDQPLQGWMTPRYVGRSYEVPPEVVQEAFALDRPKEPRRMSLDSIAAAQGITIDEMQARLDAAVAAFRQSDGRASR